MINDPKIIALARRINGGHMDKHLTGFTLARLAKLFETVTPDEYADLRRVALKPPTYVIRLRFESKGSYVLNEPEYASDTDAWTAWFEFLTNPPPAKMNYENADRMPLVSMVMLDPVGKTLTEWTAP